MSSHAPLLNYVCGTAWAMHRRTLDSLSAILERHMAGEHLDAAAIAAAIGRPAGEAHPVTAADAAAAAEQPALPPDAAHNRAHLAALTGDGLAILPVRGVLARYADQVNDASQPIGRSYESLRVELQALAASEQVRAIVLRLDTPGGAATGLDETADLVRQIDTIKPVYAYAEGGAHSAGYYIASQARLVGASRLAVVGSIGVWSMVVDSSAAAEKAGLRIRVIASGPHKGTGAPGVPVTDEQLEPQQRIVDQMAAIFQENVAAGRGMEPEAVAALADGRSWIAADALGRGLVDHVETFDAFITRVRADLTGEHAPNHSAAAAASGTKEQTMLTTTEMAALIEAHPPHAALIARAAAEDKDASQIEALIVEADRAAALAALQADLTTTAKERDEARNQAAKLQAENDQLKARVAKIDGMTADLGVTDPGSSTETHTADLSDEDLQRRWAAMTPAQQGEFCNCFAGYAYAIRHPDECGLPPQYR